MDSADNLFESVGMGCKGWSMSGSDPHPDVTKDGLSVAAGGIVWWPKIDSVSIKILPVHFGRRFRGKLVVGTEIFEGSFEDLNKFVPTLLCQLQLVTSGLIICGDCTSYKV